MNLDEDMTLYYLDRQTGEKIPLSTVNLVPFDAEGKPITNITRLVAEFTAGGAGSGCRALEVDAIRLDSNGHPVHDENGLVFDTFKREAK